MAEFTVKCLVIVCTQTAHETKSRGNESDIGTVRNMSEIATENMVCLKDIVGSMPILNLKGTTRKGSKEKFSLETECGPKNPCPPFEGKEAGTIRAHQESKRENNGPT